MISALIRRRTRSAVPPATALRLAVEYGDGATVGTLAETHGLDRDAVEAALVAQGVELRPVGRHRPEAVAR
jgi:hypothetical protein